MAPLKKLIWTLFLIFPLLTMAADWQLVPEKSTLSFTATQNNSPVTGKFTVFTLDIKFDPQQLAADQVKATVDINSIQTDYSEVATTLKSADWFDVKTFPKAVFISESFVKTGDKTYQAKGNLTIRDKTAPIIINFRLETYTANEALVKGTTTFNRSAFNLGKGEWADTKQVKDEVKVDFVIAAKK